MEETNYRVIKFTHTSDGRIDVLSTQKSDDYFSNPDWIKEVMAQNLTFNEAHSLQVQLSKRFQE